MNSPFAILFLAIQNRIGAIVDGNGHPIFKFIEQDLSQLEDATKGFNRPPVSWPCALIDIDDANFKQIGENAETGVVGVCVRIGFPPYSSTEIKVPDTYKNKALYYYDLEQALILALHGWSPGVTTINSTGPITFDLSDIFGHLIRVRATKEDRSDFLRVRCIYFTLSMDDYSTMNQVTTTPATLHLDAQIIIPT
jgi:hypothetical protein